MAHARVLTASLSAKSDEVTQIIYVNGFGKRCIVHTSDFEYLEIYKNRNESYRVEIFREDRGIVVLYSIPESFTYMYI